MQYLSDHSPVAVRVPNNSVNVRRGFTLIELMIVVVIIGLLTSIAIPKFAEVSKLAKQSEAGPVLKQILTLEERYKAKAGTYTNDISLLEGGPSLSADGKYYSFSVALHSSGFCAQASLTSAGTAAGLTPLSMDADQTVYSSATCS